MKKSTKFWIFILSLTFIVLQFYPSFREGEFILFIIILLLYLIISFIQIFAYIQDKKYVDEFIIKLNIFYWIFYIPITSFNNWLDKF